MKTKSLTDRDDLMTLGNYTNKVLKIAYFVLTLKMKETSGNCEKDLAQCVMTTLGTCTRLY